MATTITWSIAQCDYALVDGSLSDVINNLHWRVNAESTTGSGASAKTYYASSYGTQSLGEPDPDNFTEYSKVTEAECISWAKSGMGADQVTSIEDSVKANIALQKAPVEGHGIPWSAA